MLNPKALGMSGGLLWGIGMFVMTFVGMVFPEYAGEFYSFMMSVYPGYEVSVMGAFVGLVYGFFDAGIGLFVFGWLYNMCNAKCPPTGGKKKK